MRKFKEADSNVSQNGAVQKSGTLEIITLPPAVELFDHYPDAACLTINEGALIARRSRASIYRDHDAGLLPFVKIGKSTRIRVGDLRHYISGGAQ